MQSKPRHLPLKSLTSRVEQPMMILAAKQKQKPLAADSNLLRRVPWESPEEEEEPALPPRGPDAVQHGDETRGRRSNRFPDLNISATALKLGITKAHLAKVLAGRSRPSIDLGLRLAEVLGKDLTFVASLYNNKRVAKTTHSKKRKQ
jgi:transcriptional regulator with XRE-family HTH domain